MRIAEALATLNRSEVELRSLIRAISKPVWLTLPGGAGEFRNSACYEASGADESSGTWLDRVAQEDRGRCEREWSSLSASMKIGSIAASLSRADGAFIARLINFAPAYDANGVFLGWCGSLDAGYQTGSEPSPDADADASNFEALLKALVLAKAENDTLRRDFRDLFEEIPVAYIHEDLDSRFIRANRAALDLLGLRADQITGTVGASLVAETPANRKALDAAFRCMREGVDPGDLVLEMRRADNGAPVWVQWWSKPSACGTYSSTMIVDITKRILMERTKAALEFSIDAAQVGEWDLDLLLDTSRRSLRHDQCFGYDHPIPKWGVEEFVRHIHPEDRARVQRSMGRAVAAQENWSSELRLVWPDGSLHWLNAAGGIYRMDVGKATRMRRGVATRISASRWRSARRR